MRTVVLLSDIHSNLPALEAVIADMRELAPDAVFVLGDMVNGCPWPNETMARLAELRWPMLMGNHDDAVLQLGAPRMESRYAFRERYGALWWTRERLLPGHLATLEGLPLELKPCWEGLPPVRLVHGIPGNFGVGLRPDTPDGWALKRLSQVAEPVLAGGHTHVPMVRRVGRWLVVNSGSVGIPYDRDVRAGYAWLRGEGADWQAGLRRVPYNLEPVDRAFETSGLLGEGGVMAEMIRRSILSGLPWVSDFVWWMRAQPTELLADMFAALAQYDATHGPGRWAFPYA